MDELMAASTSATRPKTIVVPPSTSTPSFNITAADKTYKHQYSNIYFVRLRLLRPFVEENAKKKWKHVDGHPIFVPRVLDVVRSQLCFIIGTVYIEMVLKPNVLEDIARDLSIPPPPPRDKYCSDSDSILIEDESGRMRIIGERLKKANLVTGVIVGALGIETNNGEFEVVDLCFAGMPPQPSTEVQGDDHMEVDTQKADEGEWIAVVSGLDIGSSTSTEANVQLLAEYLVSELGGDDDVKKSSRISRLIIAGSSLASVSLAPSEKEMEDSDKRSRRYGDTTSFSTHPMHSLSATLLDIAQVMPIHILPGPTDPSGTILPQQKFPRSMFGAVSAYSSFVCETNPTYLNLAGGSELASEGSNTRTLLINSGQPLSDMFKYLPSPPASRLAIAEATLKWRHMSPTAPDTLWCHPYFTTDPFVLTQTPDIYIIGNQPKFQTRLVKEQEDSGDAKKRCRIILVPEFVKTGMVVLVNLGTLAVRTVKFSLGGISPKKT